MPSISKQVLQPASHGEEWIKVSDSGESTQISNLSNCHIYVRVGRTNASALYLDATPAETAASPTYLVGAVIRGETSSAQQEGAVWVRNPHPVPVSIFVYSE